MDYRIDTQQLLDILGQWNHFIKRKVHLIACGGTALTLLGIKNSTKEIDLERVDKHFKELARHDVSEERLISNIEHFMSLLREEGLYG